MKDDGDTASSSQVDILGIQTQLDVPLETSHCDESSESFSQPFQGIPLGAQTLDGIVATHNTVL